MFVEFSTTNFSYIELKRVNGDILFHGNNSYNISTLNNIMNYKVFICETIHSYTQEYSLGVIAFGLSYCEPVSGEEFNSLYGDNETYL